MQDDGIVHAFHAQQAFLAGLGLPLFLAMDGGHIGLHHVFCPHQIGDVGADAEPGGIGIGEEDQAVFLRQGFQQLLAFFVLVDAKAVCQQDHGIGQVGKAGGIVFALHHQHPVGVQQFSFTHRPLPASARRQSAASSRVCTSTGWLFKLLSRSSSTCRQVSSWPSV